MGNYILRRLFSVLVLLFVISLGVSMLIHILPGDPAAIILGGTDANPTEEQLQAVREQLGLDRPLIVQYGTWLTKALQGDFGESLLNHRPVGPDLLQRAPRTLMLIVPAIVLAVGLGVPLGIAAAYLRRTWIDPVLSGLAVIGFSMPTFVLGPLLVLVISLQLGWLPPSGFVSFADNPVEALRRLVLPVLSIAVGPIATTMRMTRTAMVEQLNSDYLRTARAKGLSERVVLFRHALRNALLPVITVTGLTFGNMFAGTVLAEYIFNWPGINNYLFRSIGFRDYPVVQGAVLLSAIIVLLVNLLTDLSYAIVDPRIRYS